MPMPPTTRLRSTVMRILASPVTLETFRTRARLLRRLAGAQPTVHYFHQVDDPYSHLAVQKLDALRLAYALSFDPHLVRPPTPDFQGDADRYGAWAHADACSIAAYHGATLPGAAPVPSPSSVQQANGMLADHLSSADFARVAYDVGERLWAAQSLPSHAGARTNEALEGGTRLRTRLGHYFGAMFYFEGEWFWGVDRLHLLERRLRDEGFARPDSTLCAPLPAAPGPEPDRAPARHVTLEYFPSLRSPYTAIGHARVVDLAARTGVKLVLRPVMPMMMRGVPAPFLKQRYIALDAAREARFHGVPFGAFVDPFGEPVRRAFALYPAAVRAGRGMEYIGSYLAAAWADGIDITSDRGLAHVAAAAGLDWPQLQRDARGDDWQSILQDNVAAMLDAGLWGVPSFRVTGGSEPGAFSCWGQDRIWRVETEIMRRARQPDPQ